MSLTLKDIAEMVGVAESTVSRAINDKPGVGEKTKQEIMEIVRKYNYKPNQLAQGLAKQETHILALFLPGLDTPAYPEIIKNIEAVANDEGYQVVLCNTDNDIQKERAYLNLLERNQIDGAIIVGGELADEHILSTALKGDNLIVLINRLTEELLIPTVLVDNARGAYLATEYLIKQDFKQIGIIMGDDKDFLEGEKLAGYKEALTDYNLNFRTDMVISTEGKRKDGYQAFLKMMELNNPPRGFFVTNNLIAVGLVEAIKMGGYLIPDDFSVVGYGESLLTSVVDPPLTVVAEPLAELGKAAANNLIKLINDESPGEMIKVLDPVLKIRGSSKSN